MDWTLVTAVLIVIVGFGLVYFSAPHATERRRQARMLGYVCLLVGLAIFALNLYVSHPRILVAIVVAAFACYIIFPYFRKRARQVTKEGVRDVRKASGRVRQTFDDLTRGR